MCLTFLEVILLLATLKMCLLLLTGGILALLDYVWWELTPWTTYAAPSTPSHTEEVIIRGARMRECDCLVCLEKMGQNDRA